MVHLQFGRGLFFSTMLVAAGLLAGCGGSSSDSAASDTASAAAASNTAATTVGTTTLNPGSTASTQNGLTIAGTPPASVAVGEAYAFHPTASAPTGQALQFSVNGKPAWATFNPNTGMLSGTPTSADVGVNVGVQITASDGTNAASLPAFEITVSSVSSGTSALTPPPSSSAPVAANSVTASVTLGWVAPTQNINGTTLTNLEGYKIYYGTASKQYTTTISVANPAALSYVINSLTVGQQYFFAVTAVSLAGVESSYSPEISATIS
jgi:hypothetical protein